MRLNELKCDSEGVPWLVQDYRLHNQSHCFYVDLFSGKTVCLYVSSLNLSEDTINSLYGMGEAASHDGHMKVLNCMSCMRGMEVDNAIHRYVLDNYSSLVSNS